MVGKFICGSVISGLCVFGAPVLADDGSATPEGVVAKVQEAAALLATQGASALDVLRDPTSAFTWKDTYIFVVDCAADRVLSNPAFPERQGRDIKQHVDYNGKQYGQELCDTAQQPGGGWVEYVWLKPGGDTPLRKISFVMSVDGQPYQLGAGIYNQTISLNDVAALTDSHQ